MISERPKIGVVSLGEAGNFGDDLILIAVVDAIYSRWPDASVTFLSFGQHLDWDEISRARGFRSLPTRVSDTPELPVVRENRRKFQDRDVIVFGGGGLLQTSHSPDRPYEWLSYLPTKRNAARVIAVGLGLGPLTNRWVGRLRRLGTPFDSAWVRDGDSLKLSTSLLGWPALECRDFIDGEFLSSFEQSTRATPPQRDVLGVALRAWPGLNENDVATKIEKAVARYGCTAVEFFVLEANRGVGADVDFTEKVAKMVHLPVEIITYDGRTLSAFIRRMLTVKASVSMKLHSSAVWASGAIPLHPIYYAPKISAFFGVPYHGLEISEQEMLPAKDVPTVPRAASALVEGVSAALEETVRGSRFTAFARFRFQLRRLLRAMNRRILKNRRDS